MLFATFIQRSDNFLPIGDALCPRGGCKVLDPSNFRGGLSGLADIAVNIAQIMAYIIGVLAIIMFVYAAFLFLIGGEKGPEKGRKVIINSIIAICIAAFSFTAVQVIINVLNEFRI